MFRLSGSHGARAEMQHAGCQNEANYSGLSCLDGRIGFKTLQCEFDDIVGIMMIMDIFSYFQKPVHIDLQKSL